jgi:hypothetical protein
MPAEVRVECSCGEKLIVRVPWFREGVNLDWWWAQHAACRSRASRDDQVFIADLLLRKWADPQHIEEGELRRLKGIAKGAGDARRGGERDV